MANIKINDVDQRVQYTATNLQTVFNIPFPFFANGDLDVYQNSTLLTITTHYTVTGAGTAAGGTLTLVTGATTSDLITIEGELTVDRTTIYSPTISNLTGSSLNNDLNTLTVMMKQAETERDFLMLSYAPYAAVSQTVTTTTDRYIPILGALQVWQKNAGDTAIEALTLPAIVAGLTANITTDNVLMKTDTSGTNLLQETGITIDDSDVLTGLAGMTVASLTYPTSDGTNGQVISTNGSGTLSFSSVGTGDVSGTGSSTDNAVVRWDSTAGISVQDSGVIISDVDAITGVTSLTIDNLFFNGNDITSTTGAVNLTPLAGEDVLVTVSAGGLFDINGTTGVVGIIDDDTMATATDTTLATSESIKAYVDSTAGGVGDVVGPASSTDNAIARFDSTTGKLLQDSSVIVSDADAITGVTSLDVDNINIDGNTVSATDSNGDMLISANGTANITVPSNSLTCGNTGGEGSAITVNGGTYDSSLKVSDIGGTKVAMNIIHRHSTTLAPLLVGARSNSETSTPAAVTDGQSLFSLFGAGWDGTDYALGAQINMEVDGTPGSNDMPGRIVFLTSPDGSQTPTEVMRISENALVKITGTQDIIHTATENDDHALEIDCDAAGFGDVKALDVAYVTGAISAGEDEAAILINIDESASTGGDVAALEVLSTAEGSADVYGISGFVNVNPILHSSGTFANMDSALNIAVDVLAALSSGGAGNISGFVADNDTMTIGDAAKFEEMEWVLDTGASGSGIAPTFEYSTGVGTWATFSPIDGTNGMRNTGAIAWLVGDIPSWAVGTGSEFLIRITRTRNSLGTTPIIDTVQVAATTEYSWDKDGDLNVKSVTVAADPTANLELATKQYVDNNAGTASTVQYDITQASHTLAVGDWVYNNAGTYTVATNTSAAAAEVVGVVVADVDTNTFTLQTNGLAEGLSGLADGTVYFLGTAGALTATEPTAVGEVVKPLLVGSGTTSGVMIPYRGEVIAAVATRPYDIPFNAGFTSAGVKEDVAVQVYGQMAAGRAGSFTGEAGYADTAPTGADLILDIKKNGTTIYTTLPEFAATSQTLTAGVLKTDGTEDFVASDRITFEITQIGSTEPGEGIRFTAIAEAS